MVAPAPQKPSAGTVAPSKIESSVSVKAMSVAVEVGLVLVIVNSRLAVPPPPTGSSVNSLVSAGPGSTKSTSAATLPVVRVATDVAGNGAGHVRVGARDAADRQIQASR